VYCRENPAEKPLITRMRRLKCRDQFMYFALMQKYVSPRKDLV
jgi:hypothetical protein